METIFGSKKDLFFMQQALEQAELAHQINEVPIGAVVVNTEGQIVARAYNSVERDCTQRAHAEALALEQASNQLGDWRLSGHWLYVTLEPCSMCMGLIKLSRIEGLVYGAASPVFGFRLDNQDDLSVYKRDAFPLLKNFIHKKRKKNE